jgi:hypothetical protein
MSGILVRNGKVIYSDSGKFGGDIVYTDDPSACRCCESGPGPDDWIDERDPVFPGPNGPGPGPNPDDDNCCGCDPATNLTGCKNCWSDDDDNLGSLAVERRVRVAARFIGGVRCYARRTDAPFADFYDEVIPFDLIVDAYPGEPGDFCQSQAFDVEFDTVTVNGKDFDIAVSVEVFFNTDTGFQTTASIEVSPSFSPFTGGGSVTHNLNLSAQSGATISDGWEAIVSSALFPSDSDSLPFTLPIGGCRSRHIRTMPDVRAYGRLPVNPSDPLLAEGSTEPVGVVIDMVVGNVTDCA